MKVKEIIVLDQLLSQCRNSNLSSDDFLKLVKFKQKAGDIKEERQKFSEELMKAYEVEVKDGAYLFQTHPKRKEIEDKLNAYGEKEHKLDLPKLKNSEFYQFTKDKDFEVITFLSKYML